MDTEALLQLQKNIESGNYSEEEIVLLLGELKKIVEQIEVIVAQEKTS